MMMMVVVVVWRMGSLLLGELKEVKELSGHQLTSGSCTHRRPE
jgi:hypothetical protein